MIIVVNLQHVSVIFFGHIQGGVFTNDVLQTQTNVKIKNNKFQINTDKIVCSKFM